MLGTGCHAEAGGSMLYELATPDVGRASAGFPLSISLMSRAARELGDCHLSRVSTLVL